MLNYIGARYVLVVASHYPRDGLASQFGEVADVLTTHGQQLVCPGATGFPGAKGVSFLAHDNVVVISCRYLELIDERQYDSLSELITNKRGFVGDLHV